MPTGEELGQRDRLELGTQPVRYISLQFREFGHDFAARFGAHRPALLVLLCVESDNYRSEPASIYLPLINGPFTVSTLVCHVCEVSPLLSRIGLGSYATP